ncbi:MAG: hypothetical protein RQ715_00580 [Methylococcales bacterium]|nr:hypothetical protein [Methylococcales bacterium]
MGPARRQFSSFVHLDPDVAAVFSDAETVNQALRELIEVAKRSAGQSAR